MSCESELLAELIPFLGVVTLGYDFLKNINSNSMVKLYRNKNNFNVCKKNIVKMLTIITSVDCFLCKT